MSSNVETPPRKTARTGEGGAGMVYGSFEDENATPRPPHPLSSLVHPTSPSLARDSAAEPQDDTHLSSAPSSRSSASTTDSHRVKRKRSTKPAKQMEERQYAKYPTQHRPVANLDVVHELIRDVVKRVRKIGRAKGILSPEHTEWAKTLSAGDADLAEDILDTSEHCCGAAPDLARMQTIVDRAARNAVAGASEAAWNSGVHDFLIEWAYSGSRVRGHLVWENITTASIIPEFVPEKDDLERADSKKVDFCIALELNNYDRLGKRLYQAGVHHLNHTDYGPVRYKPIALSIETKLTGEGGATALVQLSTWTSAQVLHLRHILHWARNAAHLEDPMIPPLPVLTVQGHTWSLYYLEHDHERDDATLWGCGQFGSTETLLGAYQVVAALQVLMLWAVEVYQPWFEEKILMPRGLRQSERAVNLTK